ncbi:MAG: hypothetical protein M3454_00705 [Actinomycetota bacterium]|nr:hypothetical protein [Actinomycetota bacterium]
MAVYVDKGFGYFDSSSQQIHTIAPKAGQLSETQSPICGQEHHGAKTRLDSVSQVSHLLDGKELLFFEVFRWQGHIGRRIKGDAAICDSCAHYLPKGIVALAYGRSAAGTGETGYPPPHVCVGHLIEWARAELWKDVRVHDPDEPGARSGSQIYLRFKPLLRPCRNGYSTLCRIRPSPSSLVGLDAGGEPFCIDLAPKAPAPLAMHRIAVANQIGDLLAAPFGFPLDALKRRHFCSRFVYAVQFLCITNITRRQCEGEPSP